MGQNYKENSGEMFGSNFHILGGSFTFSVGTAHSTSSRHFHHNQIFLKGLFSHNPKLRKVPMILSNPKRYDRGEDKNNRSINTVCVYIHLSSLVLH